MILRGGDKCLVTGVYAVPGLGTFYEVLLPDGSCLLVDASDIQEVV